MHRQSLKAALLCSAFLAFATAASASARDELIDQIIDTAGRPAAVSADSENVTKTLAAARAANPSVDQSTWEQVRRETAAALTSINSGSESPFVLQYQAALAQFSDLELQNLLEALRNPLLVKLREALRSNANIYKKTFMPNVLRINSDVNQILQNHSLKPTGP
ncbi:MAG: hypothetical protein JO133_09215 [Burkholderiaceae bacterium]|nr:hypothetical protein [Burkholderiaceae bacterium]